jgi:hypothetical protein
MFSTKLVTTLLTIGALVFGSIQLGRVPMPDLHQLCGTWG